MRVSILALVAALAATPAAAQTYTITNLNSPVPAGESWGQLPNETRGPNASVSIQGAVSRDGDGALQLTGDRTRAQTGIQYSPATPTGATLDQVSSLTFEWMVTDGGNGGIQSPALRLYVQDGQTRSELIWEAAYNDANGAGSGFFDLNSWYQTNADAVFWRYENGPAGVGFTGTSGIGGGSYVFNTIAGWGASSFFTDSAFVSGVGVGNGSGSGASFVAFADNVTATGSFGSRTFNFAAPAAAVPEPGTWAMMLIGFGVIGGSMRRQRRGVGSLSHA